MNDITFVRAAKAADWLNSAAFQEKWQTLYSLCPWATVCQSEPFVRSWYDVYKDHYVPLLLFAASPDGSLTGFLPLAEEKKTSRVTVAGAENAEYQCWLELPGRNLQFITSCLLRLFSDYPNTDFSFKYLPPGAPIHPLLENLPRIRHVSLKEHTRPLMRTCRDKVKDRLGSKDTKRKLNALKRLGPVSLFRVKDSYEFETIFDEIVYQCDRRQKQAREIMPFHRDPLKKTLYVQFHKIGILHSTILQVDGKTVASHCGLICKNSVQLCVIAHALEFEKHSPGSLLITLLGIQLRDEGVDVFDLTPGGDAYKERFATDHDVVYEIKFYGRAHTYYLDRMSEFIRPILKKGVLSLGIQPLTIKRIVRRVVNRIFI